MPCTYILHTFAVKHKHTFATHAFLPAHAFVHRTLRAHARCLPLHIPRDMVSVFYVLCLSSPHSYLLITTVCSSACSFLSLSGFLLLLLLPAGWDRTGLTCILLRRAHHHHRITLHLYLQFAWCLPLLHCSYFCTLHFLFPSMFLLSILPVLLLYYLFISYYLSVYLLCRIV